MLDLPSPLLLSFARILVCRADGIASAAVSLLVCLWLSRCFQCLLSHCCRSQLSNHLFLVLRLFVTGDSFVGPDGKRHWYNHPRHRTAHAHCSSCSPDRLTLTLLTPLTTLCSPCSATLAFMLGLHWCLFSAAQAPNCSYSESYLCGPPTAHAS